MFSHTSCKYSNYFLFSTANIVIFSLFYFQLAYFIVKYSFNVDVNSFLITT
jgi:hypothetical protein